MQNPFSLALFEIPASCKTSVSMGVHMIRIHIIGLSLVFPAFTFMLMYITCTFTRGLPRRTATLCYHFLRSGDYGSVFA